MSTADRVDPMAALERLTKAAVGWPNADYEDDRAIADAETVRAALQAHQPTPDGEAAEVEREIISRGAQCRSSAHTRAGHSALACWICGGTFIDPREATPLRALLAQYRAALLSEAQQHDGEREKWRTLNRSLAEAVAKAAEQLRGVEEPVAQRIADILWSIPTATLEEVEASDATPIKASTDAREAEPDEPVAWAVETNVPELGGWELHEPTLSEEEAALEARTYRAPPHVIPARIVPLYRRRVQPEGESPKERSPESESLRGETKE